MTFTSAWLLASHGDGSIGGGGGGKGCIFLFVVFEASPGE